MDQIVFVKTQIKQLETLFPKLSNDNTTNVINEIIEILRTLRNICAGGTHIQDCIIENEFMLKFIDFLLTNTSLPNQILYQIFWQFLANLCVENKNIKKVLYIRFGEVIIHSCESTIDAFTDIKLMILYNLLIDDVGDDLKIFELISKIWKQIIEQNNTQNLDFLHLIYEYFLVSNSLGFKTFLKLPTDYKIIVLKYLQVYMQNDNCNGLIQGRLLNQISKEFKKKSDCILKLTTTYMEGINPVEVIELLRTISIASGSDKYLNVFHEDHSLFINIGSILSFLMEQIKTNANCNKNLIPLQKLKDVAPSSKEFNDVENEITYELRTILVRTLSNLLYKNLANQNYAKELNFISPLLECTQMDARNPLMKEWAIIAIRNLCKNNAENQNFIANLNKLGDIPNDLIEELNLKLGTMRLKEHQ